MISRLLQLLTITVLLSSICLSNDSFMLDSIPEAEKLSQSTGQPILLVFGADYCGYCNKLKTDILDKKVGLALNRYIICYVDLTKNSDYKEKYNISIIPDSRIIVDGKQVSKMQGYSRTDFTRWIENVK